MLSHISQNQTDPTTALFYGLLLAFGTNVLIAIIQYFLQRHQLDASKKHIEMQLKAASENLKEQLASSERNLIKQLSQNEKNMRYQLMYKEHNNAVTELRKILDSKKGKELKEELKSFLDKPVGYYLPKDIQILIKKEINEVEQFIYKEGIELGMIDPEYEEKIGGSYNDWYKDLDPVERSEMAIDNTYKRFMRRMKEKVRDYTSI